jgi:hypothetical protein
MWQKFPGCPQAAAPGAYLFSDFSYGSKACTHPVLISGSHLLILIKPKNSAIVVMMAVVFFIYVGLLLLLHKSQFTHVKCIITCMYAAKHGMLLNQRILFVLR